MLELVPKIGARRYVIRQNGVDVAELNRSWFREAAQLTIDGVAHSIRREHLAAGAFTLCHDDAVVARARKPSHLHNRFEIQHEGRRYDLVKASWWTRRFEVHVDGHAIGFISPRHPLTRRAAIVLPADLTLPLQVFLAALVVFLWDREAASAAGT